jgi:hypothetical protein
MLPVLTLVDSRLPLDWLMPRVAVASSTLQRRFARLASQALWATDFCRLQQKSAKVRLKDAVGAQDQSSSGLNGDTAYAFAIARSSNMAFSIKIGRSPHPDCTASIGVGFD